MQNVVVNPGGTLQKTFDVAANDSSKDFTVPSGKIWFPRFIAAQLTATATVGSRGLYMRIVDPSANTIWQSPAVTITASQNGTLYAETGRGAESTTVRPLANGVVPNASLSMPLPDLRLPAGYIIRILDGSGVDAAADDLNVVLFYDEFDGGQ